MQHHSGMANYSAMPNETPGTGSVEHALAAFEDVRKRIEDLHAPDFLNIDITMPQAKILRLVESSAELHMSELVRRLGVSLSTISGHVDRLVEHGLLERRTDPADRRQGLLVPTAAAHEIAERFRQLSSTQLRRLLDRMSRDERLDVVRAFGHIARAVEQDVLDRATDPERMNR
jgi:DNA-binding MarR family transcriptional regulator